MCSKYFLFLLLLTSFTGCFGEKDKVTELKIDEQTKEGYKMAYALGNQYAKGLSDLAFEKTQQEYFVKGVTDYFSKKSQLTNNDVQVLAQKVDQIRIEMRKGVASSERKAGAEKSEKILASDPEFIKLESGIVYKILKQGQTIPNPTAGSFVGMKYESSRLNGDIYESTMSGNPRNLPLRGIFKAWQKAFELAGAGGEIILISPPEFTYGNNGAMPYVKPGEYLKFKIQFYKYFDTNPKG